MHHLLVAVAAIAFAAGNAADILVRRKHDKEAAAILFSGAAVHGAVALKNREQ